MSIAISGSSITFPDQTQMSTATGGSFRNRIINGDMRIDQRNAGASVNPANADVTLDRWGSNMYPNASKYTVVQSSTAPVGFNSSLLVTSSSSYSVGATDIYTQFQWVEGFNTADLGWGTANAKTVTVSFWVRSSLTGTFGGALFNSDGTRSYPFTYTINSANTFEQKTITIAGDTSGTWLTTNGRGIAVAFGLGVGATYSGTAGAWAAASYYSATGATSVVGTNGATFYITGVQLEAGSTATEFERRPIGTELALCQRYFEITKAGIRAARESGNLLGANIPFKVTKRAVPTMTRINDGGSSGISFQGFINTDEESSSIQWTVSTTNAFVYNATSTASAEL